ncbi:MAG TPA: rhodanese-like domain-containing protein [Planctomycetota bacterium]|nr:rhodanese-like domain-containing protein [Planctomycetota bacterium]
MEFQQFYLGCLAQASYLVGDGGECAIVDPRRDVEEYLAAAAGLGLKVRHVIETHLHADFVSGHVELARRTGATIWIGHRAGAAFPHRGARDGDEIVLGRVTLRFLETPGHTPESTCVLITDRGAPGAPQKLLTGDTLFIGDVGRPDLVAAKGSTPQQMAGLLFDSLQGKLLTLPDATEVWPAHGAGSACGKNISSARSSTIGEQRKLNTMLQPMSREQFIALATAELAPPPRYFGHDAEINRRGAPVLAEMPRPPALSPAEVRQRLQAGAVLLDVRDAQAFGAGHVPGSLNIGLTGSFAPWAGSLLPLDRPLVLVADGPAQGDEAVVRLARVGLHEVAGFVDGGVAGWAGQGQGAQALPQLPPAALLARLAPQAGRGADKGAARGELAVLDVRRPGEHAGGHVPGAVNVPLADLERRLGELDPRRPTAVICQTGYRSSAAASLLRRAGFPEVFNVPGGTAAWIAAGHPVDKPQPASA